MIEKYWVPLKGFFVSGFLYLIPVLTFLFLLSKVYEWISGHFSNFIAQFGVKGFLSATVFVFLCFFIACVSVGLGLKYFSLASKSGWLEHNFLNYLPGYSKNKKLLTQKLKLELQMGYSPVLVKIDECWNMGFCVEENDRFCVVHIVSSDSTDNSHVHIVDKANVRKLVVPENKWKEIQSRSGKGLLSLMEENSIS
ncbi:MAG: hypothetical protein RIR48_478 [Bacteroidota bacterium]|jgi:hypothetical protein